MWSHPQSLLPQSNVIQTKFEITAAKREWTKTKELGGIEHCGYGEYDRVIFTFSNSIFRSFSKMKALLILLTVAREIILSQETSFTVVLFSCLSSVHPCR